MATPSDTHQETFLSHDSDLPSPPGPFQPTDSLQNQDSLTDDPEIRSCSLNLLCIYGLALLASYVIFFWALATEVSCDKPLLTWMGIHNFIVIPGITIAFFLFRKYDRKLELSYRASQIEQDTSPVEIDDPLGGAPVHVSVGGSLKTHKYYKRRTFSLIFLCVFLGFWFVWEIIGCSFIIEEEQCSDTTTFIVNTFLAFGGLSLLTIVIVISIHRRISNKSEHLSGPFSFGWNRHEFNSNTHVQSTHETLLDSQYDDSLNNSSEDEPHPDAHSYIIAP